jgi:SET domain-containing protein
MATGKKNTGSERPSELGAPQGQSGERPGETETQSEWRQPFEIRGSKIQGSGAFATRPIKAGEQVAEYNGEVIDEETAYSRYEDDKMVHHHTFLFALEDGGFIDAGATGGNDARFINHSCDPNSEAYEEDGRLFVRALKDIPQGEEITYDYRLQREGKPKKSWRKLYACHCGAKNCRGTMLIDLPEFGKKKSKGKAKKKGGKKKK